LANAQTAEACRNFDASSISYPEWLREREEGCALSLSIQPGARKSGFKGAQGDAMKLAIAAPPVDGAANEALMVFLAEYFDVRRSRIEIIRGQSARSKVVLLRGALARDVLARLSEGEIRFRPYFSERKRKFR
jgi:uncharacterized protein (TIGR00251 family)